MTLTKSVLTELIQKKTGYSLRESKELLEMILEEIKIKLEDGESVKISGFGRWTVRDKKPRPGRNPSTGASLEISARRVISFNPSIKLRTILNQDRAPSTATAVKGKS
ncbi:MAG: integration host factor subunit alpha [Proteobacteria bacterium]|nr:integration host factor subunit alpha [Pseudomonadota bacterium]